MEKSNKLSSESSTKIENIAYLVKKLEDIGIEKINSSMSEKNICAFKKAFATVAEALVYSALPVIKDIKDTSKASEVFFCEQGQIILR